MNNADLYQESNSLQKRDVTICLEKHAAKIKWKNNNNSILDIGCGDGSVTNILKTYIPTDFKLLGCDKSESMVAFAKDHHSDEHTSYIVLDIIENIPEEMRNSFDHVFSFYTLHWVKDQERAFQNIFHLMNQDSECFLIFLASHPIYDVYRTLAGNDKWSTYLQDVEKYVTPCHDLKDPVIKIRNMMENIGFIDVDVEIKEMLFAYDDLDSMKKAVTSINPFRIPIDNYEDFHKDYMEVLRNITNNDSSDDIRFYYKLLIVYGHKRSKSEFENNTII